MSHWPLREFLLLYVFVFVLVLSILILATLMRYIETIQSILCFPNDQWGLASFDF